MRAGVFYSGAIAIAALCTAALISADFLGRPQPGASKRQAASAAAQPPKPEAVRQIAAAAQPSAPAPVAQPAPPPLDLAPVAAPKDPPPAPASVETTASVPRSTPLFVAGMRVALRAEPNSKAMVVERLNAGQRVAEIARQGEWVQVRLIPSKAEGWVSASLVSAKKPD